MLRVATVVLALAAPPAATLHGGETRWFQPGELKPGAHISCVTAQGSLLLTVPRATSGAAAASNTWTGATQASVTVKGNGAAEVSCGTSAPAPARPTLPYVVGRNGLGLIRGPNTLARVQRLFGTATRSARATGCVVAWRSLGLRATFSACRAGAALTAAQVTGARWRSLDGVGIGDSVAQLRFEDQAAKRLAPNRWLLGGVGAKRPPRLVAVVAHGVVARFDIQGRP